MKNRILHDPYGYESVKYIVTNIQIYLATNESGQKLRKQNFDCVIFICSKYGKTHFKIIFDL